MLVQDLFNCLCIEPALETYIFDMIDIIMPIFIRQEFELHKDCA